MSPGSATALPVEVFYSYAHEDKFLRDRLDTHLSLLQRQGIIKGWHDRLIGAGTEWKGAIHTHLNRAGLILLLISADFLASDYCYDTEMGCAMDLHEKGSARVIPILLRPVDWNGAPFAKLQFLPRDGKPVSQWADQEEAFHSIAVAIREILQSPAVPSPTGQAPPRGQWRIQIEGVLEDFDSRQLDDMVRLLKRLAADLQIKLIRVEPGSVVLVLEGSREGFDRLEAFFHQGVLSEKLKVQVKTLRWDGPLAPMSEGRGNPEGAPLPSRQSLNGLTAADVLEQLKDPGAPVLKLLARCREPDHLHVWNEDRALVRRFAELLLAQKHPTLALEVASRGLDAKLYPGDHELLYWRALALVNSGNTTRGDDFVRELLAAPGLSPHWQTEALSLAGRVRKDRATRTADAGRRRDLFRQAYDYYSQASALSGHYFPGINAATLARLGGTPGQSTDLATRVGNDVRAQLRQPGNEDDYWLWATLGEACLLLADPGARDHYEKAVALARAKHAHGHIASMGRQVRLLAPVLPAAADLLPLFRVNPVVVFAGHNLDQPGDPVRFPADGALEEAVRLAIKAQLDVLAPGVGYCTPGCGSDILFAELMRQRSAELHLVLPFAEDDFCVERLTYDLPELAGWQRRYETLRGPLRVPLHFATTEEYLNDQVLHDFCGTFMQGLALTRAAQDDAEAIALVVHDPTAPPGPGGVLTFIENWRRTRRRLRLINLADVRSKVTLTPLTLTGGSPRPRRTPQREVGVMLFADVAGFSGLPEPHLPAFFEAFLGEVAQELKASAPPLFQNTWGDGLYLVFADVVSCADFALRLLRRLERFNFDSFRFKLKEDQKPGVRIGLHTGPVFKGRDAIIDKENYFGSHVSRAARIEPVTAPGCAFCSEQFAAALAMAPGHDFVCEYLGMQPLAKEYDTCPLYRLTHREPGSPASQTGS